MDVILSPELEEFVKAQVRDGRYANASDVISEGLRRLREHEDELDDVDMEEVRRKVRIGIEQADRGELVDFDEALCDRIHEQGMKRLQEQRRKEKENGAISSDTTSGKRA